MKPLPFEEPIFELKSQIQQLQQRSESESIDLSEEIAAMTAKLEETKQQIYQNLTPWQRVQISRHTARPFMLDYIAFGFENFYELHGDRHCGDDASMPAGLATIGGEKVVVIGHQKGRTLEENIQRNFGSAHPEGYRKALRIMKLAEKFQLPIISIIDTPGAFPGVGSEERNIAEAIAFNIREMMGIKTPIIAVTIGEGGSGGALGIGVADKVLLMENAYYSVISPEGCAAILWKHRQHAPEAAESLKITSPDLKQLNLIDEAITEPVGGAHHDIQQTVHSFKTAILKELKELKKVSKDKLLKKRYARYRNIGEWQG